MEDFLEKLDADISNIGTNKIWKKKIGDKILWLSPIPYTAQLQLNDALASDDLGNNAIFETKRLTLSHSIVGFGEHDLRKYKDQNIFEIPQRGKTEKVKVNLQKYVHHKIGEWDSEFLDVAFQILADCLESNKKETLKDVEFENLKEPIEELAEFESKVHELRDQLGMPPLVEAGKDSKEDLEKEPEEAAQEEPSEAQEEPSEAQDNSVPLDPFEAIENPEEAAKNISVPAPQPQGSSQPQSAQSAQRSEPVRSVPIPKPPPPELSPIEREIQRRNIKNKVKTGNTPETAHVAQPSVDQLVKQDQAQGVVEESKANKPPVSPPRIDPPTGNKNPRFAPRR